MHLIGCAGRAPEMTMNGIENLQNGTTEGIISIPLRRMTQSELDIFLEKAADILRGNVDHSEFRGYVFALLFFKRISDVFEEAVRNLSKKVGEELAKDPAMQKKSLPFVVPPDSMWEAVTIGTPEKKVTSLQLGQSLNDAMLAIERANAPKFDGILTSKIDFNKVAARQAGEPQESLFQPQVRPCPCAG